MAPVGNSGTSTMVLDTDTEVMNFCLTQALLVTNMVGIKWRLVPRMSVIKLDRDNLRSDQTLFFKSMTLYCPSTQVCCTNGDLVVAMVPESVSQLG